MLLCPSGGSSAVAAEAAPRGSRAASARAAAATRPAPAWLRAGSATRTSARCATTATVYSFCAARLLRGRNSQ
eukprot:scaffold289479_cov18-Prasinocladus_malaysianus.AAC.1